MRIPKYVPFLKDLVFWKFVKMLQYEQTIGSYKLYSVRELRNMGAQGYDFLGLRHALRYFENHGYQITVTDPTVDRLLFPQETANLVKPFDLGIDLYPFQAADVAEFLSFARPSVVLGHSPGLGKTIVAGEILRQQIASGLRTKVLWVVPKGDLTLQVQEEMREKFGVDVEIVTGETHSPRDRRGASADESVYYQHPFIVTTWGVFRSDIKNNIDLFCNLPIYLILDEVHVVSEYSTGILKNLIYNPNVSFRTCRKAPFLHRIGLTGTPMPNGHWWELIGIVDALNPAGCPATKYFDRMLDARRERVGRQMPPDLPEQISQVKADINDLRMTILTANMIRHTKEEVADQLPALIEINFPVELRKGEKRIYKILVEMFLDFVKDKIPNIEMFDPWGKLTEKGKTYNSTRDLLWQVMRVFSSYGTKYLHPFLQRCRAQEKAVYVVIYSLYGTRIEQIHTLLAGKKIRPIPKNESLSEWCGKYAKRRGVIFANRVDAVIELAKALRHNGIPAKIILGRGNQLSPADAKLFHQPQKFTSRSIEGVKRWFWFPWGDLQQFLINPTIRFQIQKGTQVVTGTPSDLQNSLWDEFITIRIAWDTPLKSALRKELTQFFAELRRAQYYDVPSSIDNFTAVRGSVAIPLSPFPDLMHRDRRILVCSDVLAEGANLQVAELVVFYDAPISIRQREQRLSRVHRLGSQQRRVILVSVMCGLERSIGEALKEKYQSGGRAIGLTDPSPVGIKQVLKYLR